MSPSKQPLPAAAPARRTAVAKPETQGLALGFKDIQTLISMVGREPIDELQFESLGVMLHIKKNASTAAAPPAAAQAASQPAATGPTHTLVAPAQPSDELPEDAGIHHITSPIVGTFYRAPSSNAAAFVQPGDFVKPGQTLCIVEAMKLMNEIECDVAGEVVAVLADNGQPVEYGERLFAIRVR
jgi:acetyl-CoA carboxylase biotin carboxyl carrier protein